MESNEIDNVSCLEVLGNLIVILVLGAAIVYGMSEIMSLFARVAQLEATVKTLQTLIPPP